MISCITFLPWIVFMGLVAVGCRSGSSTGCNQDEDCADGKECVKKECREILVCISDEQCDELRPICDTANNRCVTCLPVCAGKCCGDDGCEGTCEDLCGLTEQTCNVETCLCEGDCVPYCENKECGPDLCRSTCPPGCQDNEICSQGVCECIPDCAGKQCGPDGCDGECQPGCEEGYLCNADGQCEDQQACPEGLDYCNGECVDTTSDPRHCNGCGLACDDGQDCQNSQCLTIDCRETPCTGLAYCDLNTGECKPGCISDDQCIGSDEQCDIATHECVCDDSYHRCSGTCVSNNSIQHCGTSCTPCPTDSHGTATCNGTTCGIDCNDGYHWCGGTDGACTICPTGAGIADYGCAADACVIDNCLHGYALYNGSCWPWSIQSIDSMGRNWYSGGSIIDGFCTSIAVDNMNMPHIAYYDNHNSGDLRYAFLTGDSWSTEMAGNDYDSGKYCSIAVEGSSGIPHISYQIDYLVANNRAMKYACKETGSWESQVVDQCDGACSFVKETSIALDRSGNPRIIYYVSDSGHSGIYCAYPSGYSWNIEMALYVHPYDLSLALSSDDDDLNIAYTTRGSDDELIYARWTGSEWELTTLASNTSISSDVLDIALDSENNPHVSYCSGGELMYIYWTGDSWDTQVIDSSALHPSIALDSNDHPHISYRDWDIGLKYARWTGSNWYIQEVDIDDDVGKYNSIALDSNDHPHISYYDDWDYMLKYATY